MPTPKPAATAVPVSSVPKGERLLRKPEVRRMLGDLSESSLFRLCRERRGDLTPLALGGITVFRLSQIERLIGTLAAVEIDHPRTRPARLARAAHHAEAGQ